jgi:hypothetical protein
MKPKVLVVGSGGPNKYPYLSWLTEDIKLIVDGHEVPTPVSNFVR